MAVFEMMARSTTVRSRGLLVGRQMGTIITDECDEHFRAPGCLKFGPTEWTDAFLEALATNKTRMSNRQSRRKIKEVLDKLGHVPRARAIDYSVD